jgi:hypothetical protein
MTQPVTEWRLTVNVDDHIQIEGMPDDYGAIGLVVCQDSNLIGTWL